MPAKFFNDANWYKGNLHTHTTISDGSLNPLDSANLYKSKGYDFLSFTDHNKVSKTIKEDNFLFLSGIELDTMLGHQGYHIVGIGMDEDYMPMPKENRKVQNMIDSITEKNGIAILAHPAWSMLLPSDTLPLKGLSGSEIWNSFSGLPHNGDRYDSSSFLDTVASCGMFLNNFASDDTHRYEFEVGVSWIMVNAAELSEKSIISAIKKGDFYASRGPDFRQIEISDDEIKVECSPCEYAVFYSNLLWSPNRVQISESKTEFTYKIKPGEKFIRIELVDENKNKATSNPIIL